MSARIFRQGIYFLILTLMAWLGSTAEFVCKTAGLDCPNSMFVAGENHELCQDGATIYINSEPGTTITVFPVELYYCSDLVFTAVISDICYCEPRGTFCATVDWTPALHPPHPSHLANNTLYSLFGSLFFLTATDTYCGRYYWKDYIYNGNNLIAVLDRCCGFCFVGTDPKPTVHTYTGCCPSSGTSLDFSGSSSSESNESKHSCNKCDPNCKMSSSTFEQSKDAMSKLESQHAEGQKMKLIPEPHNNVK